jgi:plasmid stability protein
MLNFSFIIQLVAEKSSSFNPLVATARCRFPRTSFAINACIFNLTAISLLSASFASRDSMAQLVVRNLDEDLVQALKKRAAAQGSSAEEAHRQILQAALRRPKRRRFADVLAAMPNVGDDADFVRQQVDRRG